MARRFANGDKPASPLEKAARCHCTRSHAATARNKVQRNSTDFDGKVNRAHRSSEGCGRTPAGQTAHLGGLCLGPDGPRVARFCIGVGRGHSSASGGQVTFARALLPSARDVAAPRPSRVSIVLVLPA
jgi:hypothetical protein